MKKYLLASIFLMISFLSKGNPIEQSVKVSEIYFDEQGNWSIEIGFYFIEPVDVDSIRLVTSSGNSLIINYSTFPGGGEYNFDYMAVITNDNLAYPLFLNQDGDFVKVLSYTLGYEMMDSVSYGDYPGSRFDCLHAGESVSYNAYDDYPLFISGVAIDNTPTIGAPNDTIGVMCTFSGIVYDTNGMPFPGPGWRFFLPGSDFILNINSDGSFSDRIFSKRYTFDKIYIAKAEPPYMMGYYEIEPVNICMRPDSIINQNIVTLSLITGIDPPAKTKENSVIVSPNPFTNKVVFYFNMENRNPKDVARFQIFSRDGKQLLDIELTTDQQKYDWFPVSNLSSGIYIYHLIKNKQIVKSGKFIRL